MFEQLCSVMHELYILLVMENVSINNITSVDSLPDCILFGHCKIASSYNLTFQRVTQWSLENKNPVLTQKPNKLVQFRAEKDVYVF